ncbi:MAG: hypothetical protein HQM09_03195 [Candidatus Riflebacteria bacterium]|nr:hypothetical protein [Candidatus Riflebacteria bacterium]
MGSVRFTRWGNTPCHSFATPGGAMPWQVWMSDSLTFLPSNTPASPPESILFSFSPLDRDQFYLNALIHLAHLRIETDSPGNRLASSLNLRFTTIYGDVPAVQDHILRTAEKQLLNLARKAFELAPEDLDPAIAEVMK